MLRACQMAQDDGIGEVVINHQRATDIQYPFHQHGFNSRISRYEPSVFAKSKCRATKSRGETKCRSPNASTIFRASSQGSSGRTSRPVSGHAASRVAPTSLATIGTPQAWASSNEIDNPSLRDGSTNRSKPVSYTHLRAH